MKFEYVSLNLNGSMRGCTSDADEQKSELCKPSVASSREVNHPWNSTRNVPQHVELVVENVAAFATLVVHKLW